MLSILDSPRFWRLISLALALAFLVLFYQSSQTGRYRFYYTPSIILDTRTGIMYHPINTEGIQELTPVFPLK